MTTARLQSRINAQLLADASAILAEQGIRISSAITMFFTEVKKKRGMPFWPSEVPNAKLIEALKEDPREMETFDNVEDMFAALDKPIDE